MERFPVARDVVPRHHEMEHNKVPAPDTRFTPGEFFLDAGGLIAVCLGLGVVVQVLLGQ